MAKNKYRPEANRTPVKPEPTAVVKPADETPTSTEETTTQAGSVFDEVQAFLAQRAELTRKLAEEIEATEKKLAELKRTAALLAPQAARPATKDKKAKKTSKPKAVDSREATATETTPAEATE